MKYKKRLLAEKFWRYVNKKEESDCWEWIGAKIPAPNLKSCYGHMHHLYKDYYAHRVSWIIHNGKIPKKLCVLHNCDNSICVNPNHLRLGTLSDNSKDRELRNRGNRRIGENSPVSKLTNKQVVNIRESYHPRIITTRMLAKKYSVNFNTIVAIVHNKTWRHLLKGV